MAADRAATLSGRFQKVTYGHTTKILGAGTYVLSGVERRTVDASEFGVDVDIYEFASANGGTIMLSDVNYDPTDPSQLILQGFVEDATKTINSNTTGILFWINSTSFLTVGTSGNILMTKAGEVRADRNGLAKTSFEGQVSGAYMYLAATIA